MGMRVLKILAKERQRQPISELERKAVKARRKGRFTVEDIDLAKAEAREMSKLLQWC